MAQNRFASVPNISIPRSRFKQPFNHATSFLHGDIIPLDCFEILPGDTYHLNLSSMIWMSNPMVPIFGNIKAYIHAFFVPMRLVWENTQTFYGENKTASGYVTTEKTIPQRSVFSDSILYDSLSHYLGKPLTTYDSSKVAAGYGMASVLKERGYYLIYNNYYRAQQIQNPVLVNVGDGNQIGTLNGNNLYFSSKPLKCCKEFDYFTAATLAPQFGPSVTLPLGSYAPVVTRSNYAQLGSIANPLVDLALVPGNGGSYTNPNGPLGVENGTLGYSTDANWTNTGRMVPGNLWADLRNATSATINDLRYSFAVQKYLERSNFGSRFFEMLAVHYGITSPDATLQIPQRLGHGVINIAVNTVLSTAQTVNSGVTTQLGQPGAVASAAKKLTSLFTKAFVEPGYLYILLETKHERSYTQGLMREDSKNRRYEFYAPEFANLGDQAILKKEIFLAGASSDDDVFGYQEHWAEYRYRPQRVSGILDPQAPSALDFWTLADDYSAAPALDATWIQEDRLALARCLVTGVSGPDYIGDFFFDYTATREMPLFTIPGLIDHFGSY